MSGRISDFSDATLSLRTPSGSGGKRVGASNPGASRQAWQREVERMQQQAWFKPGAPLQAQAQRPVSNVVSQTDLPSVQHALVQRPSPVSVASTHAANPQTSGITSRPEPGTDLVMVTMAGLPDRMTMPLKSLQADLVALRQHGAGLTPLALGTDGLDPPGLGTTVRDGLSEFSLMGDAAVGATARIRREAAEMSGTAQPLRVHLDWQGQGLRIWVGHDEGMGQLAQRLIGVVDRWLRSQGLAIADVVVNGRHIQHAPGSTPMAAPQPRSDAPRSLQPGVRNHDAWPVRFARLIPYQGDF